MDPSSTRVTASAPVIFEDGLGPRRVALGVGGAPLEVLALRDELTAASTFEFAVRDRVSRLAEFHSEHYPRVHGVEKAGKGGSRLALVSDHFQGVRLSQILATAERQLLPVETNAALCLLRQLVHAVAVLHEKVPDLCHGAIGPERLVVTAHGRLMVVEHVLGSALEQLRYSHKQYWQQLRVPLQRTLSLPHFDRRSDVVQIGATALALIIGRPLTDDEFPGRVDDMTGSALSLSADGALEPLPLPLRVWLQRALQIDSRTPFSSAIEAWGELDRVLHYSDPIREAEALKTFLARYHGAVGTTGAATTQAATAPRMAAIPAKPVPWNTPVPVMSTRASQPAPSPGPMPTKPVSPSVPTAAPAPMPAVAATTPSSAAPLVSRPAFNELDDAPAPTGGEQIRQSVPARTGPSRARLLTAAVILILLTAGATLIARRFLIHPVAAGGTGSLVVQTNPNGAEVEIDGQRRGVTPLSVDLPPGRHALKLSSEGAVRSMPVTITAGGQVSQFIELPRVSAVLGELRVRTEPAGARVTVDGHVFGQSPVTVEGLSPGTHTVLLEHEMGSITQDVKIDAGTTASLLVPLGAPRNAPVSGWISVAAPAEVQIYEGGRLLGTSQSDRIMMSAGRHNLEFVSEALGYRESRVVSVTPGRVFPLKPKWPMGSLSLNAVPWAQVWVDGRPVGETPLGKVAVPIGFHELVFRHPDLGEKVVNTLVTLNAPAKVSVDLRQR